MTKEMTPSEFEAKMQQIKDEEQNDPEICHERMDDLISQLLIKLGYEAGIKIFDEAEKWYS